MTEIAFLGTGGSVATPERDNTSFLLQVAQQKLLIDCPGSVIQKLRKLDVNPADVSAIFVTHIHPDHIYGLPSFVHSLMLEEGVVSLYGSRETVDFCRDLLDVFHLRDKKFKRRVDLIALEPDKRIPVGEALEVSAFSTPHSSASLAYHFYFKGEGKELLYSGDTPPMPRLIQEAAGIDYLVHDSSSPARFFQQYPILKTMHTHSLELGALARKADVKCLIPIHFFGEVEFSLTEIEEEIRENFQGRLIVPRDFDIVPL